MYVKALIGEVDAAKGIRLLRLENLGAEVNFVSFRFVEVSGVTPVTDFTLEVEIKLEGKTGTSTAGIVFHAKNYAASSHDSYTSMQGYYLALNNNQIVLERLNYADDSKNIATMVQNNPFATSDQFIPLKIQVRGNRIVVWSGETKLIDVTDSRAFVNGKIGLYTNGAAAVFRNLKVSA